MVWMRKQERSHSVNSLFSARERIYRESLVDTALCFDYKNILQETLRREKRYWKRRLFVITYDL